MRHDPQQGDGSVEEVVSQADVRFHAIIAEASGNPALAALVDTLNSRTLQARVWRGYAQVGVFVSTLAEHVAILDALRDRDPSRGMRARRGARRVRRDVHPRAPRRARAGECRRARSRSDSGLSSDDRILGFELADVRFPTSPSDGSDAMNPDPDYSAAYVVIHTDAGHAPGHGFAFTIGRGNEVAGRGDRGARAAPRRAATVEPLLADMGRLRRLVHDSQLRWLGPEKGVIHMAIGAVVNALWDLRAKREGCRSGSCSPT